MPLVRAPLQIAGQAWKYDRCYVFGVVNVTPDSFSDGGKYGSAERAIAHGKRLIASGADALDIGGESTRPGAEPVDAAQELQRVLPVIAGLRDCGVPLSVDTYKSEVARVAIAEGATIINDISGFGMDGKMPAVVAETGALVIIGHLRGQPQTMQQSISFVDVVAEVIDELRASIRQAIDAGVTASQIWVDPCLGFGKTAEQTLQLLAATDYLREALGYPLMIGPSRKSFIGQLTDKPAEERLMGTAGAVAAAATLGADAVRLHDVAEVADALKVAQAVGRQRGAFAADPTS
ncbi:MAG: dihydropteroate synthase [Deltaproteobacteria bacterium]|nr:dihydropteroate synthase [Deltaproteobacteria bacterium]